MTDIHYSLCPQCNACPEVVITDESVTVGEEGSLVRLSRAEWNVLVTAIRNGDLDVVETGTQAASNPTR